MYKVYKICRSENFQCLMPNFQRVPQLKIRAFKIEYSNYATELLSYLEWIFTQSPAEK
jgi:hypothetical protein